MAGTTGLAFLHLSHGKVFTATQVIEGVVANAAIITVLLQVQGMAENHRLGAFEGESDILGFDSQHVSGHKQ